LKQKKNKKDKDKEESTKKKFDKVLETLLNTPPESKRENKDKN